MINPIFTISWLNFRKLKNKFIAYVTIVSITLVLFNVFLSIFIGINNSFDKAVVSNKSLQVIEVQSSRSKSTQLTLDSISTLDKNNNVLIAYPSVDLSIYFAPDTMMEGDPTLFVNAISLPDIAIPFFTKSKQPKISEKGIIISKSFAEKIKLFKSPINLSIGDEITFKLNKLIGVTQQTSMGTVIDIEFIVEDIVDDLNSDLGASNIYINLETAINLNLESEGQNNKDLSNLKIYNAVVIVKDINKLEEVSREISKLGFQDTYSLSKIKTLPTLSILVGIVGILLVGTLIVFSVINIATLVSQQLKLRHIEFGILRCIGYTKRNIMDITIMELIFITIYIFMIVSIFSFLIIYFINFLLITLNLKTQGFEVILNIYQFPLSFAILFLMTIGTNLVVLVKHSKLTPIELLKNNL